jgi:hypothetical protein
VFCFESGLSQSWYTWGGDWPAEWTAPATETCFVTVGHFCDQEATGVRGECHNDAVPYADGERIAFRCDYPSPYHNSVWAEVDGHRIREILPEDTCFVVDSGDLRAQWDSHLDGSGTYHSFQWPRPREVVGGSACGIGFELALVLPLLWGLRRVR